MRRLVVGAAAVVVFLSMPTLAWADPAVPTHYRSTVTEVRLAELDNGSGPDDSTGVALQVDIIGGDALVVIRAHGQHVEVPGYDDEPYVRIQPDGVVELNERSPARWLNDARYGSLEISVPPSADSSAPPAWTVVGDDGEFAWHDHRIHFMSPQLPRHIDPTRRQVQHVFDWQVPVVVDGREVVIAGQLEWIPGPDATSHIAVVAAGLAAAALAGWGMRLAARSQRRQPTGLTSDCCGPVRLVLAVAAVVAVMSGLGGWVNLPNGAEGDAAGVVLPVSALVLLAGSVAVASQRRDGRGRLVVAGIAATATLPLAGWVGTQAASLVRPIVPNLWPASVVRMSVAVVAAVLVTAWSVAAIPRRS
ncbi:MAG: hypothetical protein WD007_04265 [Nitriliruptoraceae bacterium]